MMPDSVEGDPSVFIGFIIALVILIVGLIVGTYYCVGWTNTRSYKISGSMVLIYFLMY